MRVVLSSGDARQAVTVSPDKASRREAATAIKRFLFSGNAAYHRAKRRGERALNGMVAA